MNSERTSKRGNYAVPLMIVAAFALPAADAFAPSQTSSRLVHTSSINLLQMTATLNEESATSSKDLGAQPVVVSAEAEALSHSETTMKLVPSFDLFQMLAEEEGGIIPHTVAGNAMRDDTILKVGIPDELEGMQLKDYKGLGGKKKIETLLRQELEELRRRE